MTKNRLFCTSALCTVGILLAENSDADGIEFALAGYMNTLFSAGGLNTTASRDDPDDDPDYNATGLFAAGRVSFRGEYEHDNGIVFGARVELEVNNSSSAPNSGVDERYFYLESDYGDLQVGSRSSASRQMHFAAPSVGLSLNSGWVTVFIPANPDSITSSRSPAVGTFLDYGKKESQIIYFTPRLEGFQLGLSYAPAVTGTGDGKNFPVEADRNSEYYNGFSFGVNYTEEFNALGVALSLGYTRADAGSNLTDLGVDDYNGVALGGSLAYAGVVVGGAYANAIDGQARIRSDSSGATVISSREGQSWGVGVAYETGPWTIGAEYFQGVVEGYEPSMVTSESNIVGAGNQDKMFSATAGAAYDLAPGVDAIGGVMWGRWSPESGAVNTGVVAAAGLSFRF